MKKVSRSTVLQFVKFGIVGVSNTLVSLGVYYVFIWIDPAWYLLGNVRAGSSA